MQKRQNYNNDTIEEDYVLENMGSGCSEDIKSGSNKH